MADPVPGDYPALSEDLMAALRQVAPPTHASGRHDWMIIMARVAGWLAAASALAAAAMYVFFL